MGTKVRFRLLISASLFVLIISLMNLPPVQAMPLLGVLDTPIGVISAVKLLILFLLFVTILAIIANRIKIYVTKLDIAIYTLTVLFIANQASLKSSFYMVIVVSLSYVIGKLIFYLEIKHVWLAAIKWGGVIQAVIVIYSMHIGHLIGPINNSFLFDSFSNGLVDGQYRIRAAGTIGHPVVLGAVLVPAVIGWIFDFFQTRGSRIGTQLLTIMLMLIQLYAVFLTYSRSAWAVTILVSVIMLIKYRARLKMLVPIGILAILLFAIPSLSSNIVDRFAVTSKEDGSYSHRALMYSWSWNQSKGSSYYVLLGHGSGGSFQRLMTNPPKDKFPAVDNMFLTFFVNMGIAGVLLLLFIIGYVLLKLRSSGLRQDWWIYFILMAQCMLGVTFELFSWEQTGILFWLLVGLSSEIVRDHKYVRQREKRRLLDRQKLQWSTVQ